MNLNKRHLAIFTFPAMILLLASGCLKNDTKEQEDHEKRVIQQYLTANNISPNTKTRGGIYFIEEIAGTGISPVLDNYVVIDFVGRYMEDGTIAETSYDSLSNEWPAAQSFHYYLYGPAKFKHGYNCSGINEGLSLMKEGGKAKIIIPSDKGYYDYKPRAYEIKLIKVIKDPVAYEDSVLQAYISEKGYNDTTMIDSLIWYKETFPYSSDQQTVEPKDTVLFRFTGSLVDGFRSVLQDNRIFDNNMDAVKPIKIVYNGRTSAPKLLSGQVLAFPKGLLLALDSMRVGTHATAVLPYTQAFGVSGLINNVYRYTIMPEYQTVLYNIIVEEIRSPVVK
jgi:FKBP-type peptidyl-prolyl cis-trans isomerase